MASFLRVGSDVPGEYWAEEHLLADRPEKWTFSLAVLDPLDTERVVGYAIASRPERDVVHLHHLMVTARERGRGHGQRLLDELRHLAALAGARTVRLKVAAANAGAIRFYARGGFELAAEEGEYRVLETRVSESVRRIAVHQPNFLPWCGYFAKIRDADVFVFLDDAQLPGGQSYLYRTRIADRNGARWLSAPIRRSFAQPIREVEFAEPKWQKKQLGSLRAQYGRRPFFKEVLQWLEPLLQNAPQSLSEFNQSVVLGVCDYLGLEGTFVRSSDVPTAGRSDDRLIELVHGLAGNVYVSGKGGQNYQDESKFAAAGIRLHVREYVPRPYPQGGETFEPGLSILDALFNLGRNTLDLLVYPDEEVQRAA